MKRKFLALTLGALLSFSLVACGQDETRSQGETKESYENESKKDDVSEEQRSEVEESTEETDIETEEVSEDVEVVASELETVDFNNLKYTLNGQEYVMPMMVSDLLSKGWVIDDEDAAVVISPNQYTLLVTAENPDGVKIYIRAINLTEEDKTFVECNLYGISVETNIRYEEKSPKFTAFGATLGQTTIEEFDAFYTEIESAHDGESMKSRTLASESTSYYLDNTIKYYFNDENLYKVEITYLD